MPFTLHRLLVLLVTPLIVYASDDIRDAFAEDADVSSGTNYTFGNFYNFWVETSSGFDLTRGNATGAKTFQSSAGDMTFQPSRSAMVIVDMQSQSASLTPFRDTADDSLIIGRLLPQSGPSRPPGGPGSRPANHRCDTGLSRCRCEDHLVPGLFSLIHHSCLHR